MATSSPSPFDLTELRRACAPVIAWYERYLEDQRLDVQELDQALVGLRRLPSVGGRLGRAVATLVSGGSKASTEDVLVSFEQLRNAAGLRTAPALTGRPAGTRKQPEDNVEQPPLPGLG